MKIFLIIFNDYDCDQYDSFVVIAETRHKAIMFLKEKYPEEDYGTIIWKSGYKTKEIKSENYKKTTEIIGSYNAG